MRILIVGAGGVGGYFGARLLADQRDVTFLVRSATAQRLATAGLHIRSPFGDLSIPAPPAVTAPQLTSPYDAVILSCKSYDLAAAIHDFTPAVGPATLVLPLLNGMAHLAVLDRHFGPARILGGLTNISAVRTADGTIQHLNPLHRLYFGPRNPETDCTALAAVLTHANFDAQLRPNILQDTWDKWVTIATAAGITCLLRANIGEIVAADAAPLVLQLMHECASIATAEGYPLTPSIREEIIAKFTQPGSPFTASMLRDLEANRQVERDQILGDLLAHGETKNIPTPLLSIANFHVRCYEERQGRK